MKLYLTGLLGAAALAATAAEKVEFKSEKEKASYAIGLSIAENLKQSGLELEAEMVARGLKEGIKGEALFDRRQIMEILTAYQQNQASQAAEPEKKAGAEFLAANKAKEGVKTLKVTLTAEQQERAGKPAKEESYELQYKVLKEGTGPKPKEQDVVKVHYRGTFRDGKVFDSSYDREPAMFPVNQVIPGWTEALKNMKVGSKWQLFIPSDLAYGDSGRPPAIPPGATLLFDVELLSIEKQ